MDGLRVVTIATRARRPEAAATIREASDTWIVLAEDAEWVVGERWPLIRSLYAPEERVRALVPFALAAALRDGASAAAFVAADTHVVDGLGPVEEVVGGAEGAVLVPRHLDPDAARTDPPFDEGFVALVGDEGLRIAEWWADRVVHDGLEVDWLARIPGVSEAISVVREPGCAVAPWNVDERRLNGDSPLHWIRLPGVGADAALPGESLAGRPQLERLVSERAASVAAAADADPAGEPEPQETADGLPLDDRLRSLFARAWRAGELEHGLYSTAGATAFRAWLDEPDPDERSGGITRYLFSIYADRRDLQDSYPGLAERETREGFYGWVHVHGAAEYGIPADLLPPRPAALDAPPQEEDPDGRPWGVNVVGNFTSKFGLGEAARRILQALDTVAMPAVPIEAPGRIPDTARGEGAWAPSPPAAPYGITLLCVNADELPSVAAEAPELFRDRYTIGLWWWEVEDFPERYDAAFEHVDEVWVGSRHVQGAIASRAPVPVFRISHAVEVPPPPQRSRAQLGLPEGFLFLFVYDYNSVARRKNPLGALDAFERAFEPGEGPQLVLKTINAHADPESHDEVVRRAERRPDVHVIEGSMPAEDRDALMAACDAYVSLHRAEGFGQTIAEAMYLGKPVIATDYSGNADFVDADSGYPIPYRLVPIGPGAGPYPADGHWADPDLDAAAEAMRDVVARPEEARRRAARAAEVIRRTHSPTAAGEAMRARLELLRPRIEERMRTVPPGLPDELSGALEELRALVTPGPAVYGTPGGRVRRVLHKLILRLARPVTVYQGDVNTRQMEALERLALELNTKTERVERAAGDLQAAALAQLRRAERREAGGGEPPTRT